MSTALRPAFATAAVAALTILAPDAAHAAVYVDDPLTDPAFPGRGSKGGSFGANGWTVTSSPTDASQDSVWYEIADALPAGSVEYTISGLSVGGSLAGNDHDIFTLYQAPSGSVEPIPYSPGFRNNDFKAFTRIFGSLETGREGAMKLEVAFCPRGDPWYHDSACPAGCDQSGIAYANGTQTNVGWDPAVAYKMTVTWGNGEISFARDGAKLGAVSYAGEYSPQPLRVRFGSPRNDGIYPGNAYMPPGITIRDVRISGTPGTQTPVCQAAAPDAGAGGSGAGGSAPDAGSEGVEYPVLQDVTGASWEAGVFPDVNDLNVEAAGDGSPGAVVYLRFPPFAGVATRAILRLKTQAISSAAGGSGVVCAVADDTWQETTLTWATRPAVGSACAGAARSVDPDTEVEWDVTPLIGSGSGNHDLVIVSADPDGAHYVSKELGGSATGPRLYVVADTSSPGTGGGGAAAGSGGAGGAAGGDPGTGGAGAGGRSFGGSGAGHGITETDGGGKAGCGCRLEGEGEAAGAGAVWGAMVAVAASLARRRRRRG